MKDYVTQKQLEVSLDRYQASIVSAISNEFGNINREVEDLKKSVNGVANTLDKFLKRLLDHEDEFTIIKAEVLVIKQIIKEKLGVEVTL